MTQTTLTYYRTNPPETAKGMKHVLWEVITDSGAKIYDWGFADWMGDHWGPAGVDIPEGYSISVFAWAHTVEPRYIVSPLVHVN